MVQCPYSEIQDSEILVNIKEKSEIVLLCVFNGRHIAKRCGQNVPTCKVCIFEFRWLRLQLSIALSCGE